MSLGTEVGLGPGDIVLDGGPVPPQKGAQQPPNFWSHVSCVQTTGWIRIPLGTDVGDIVLDGDPALPTIGAQHPFHFLAHVCCGETIAHLS